MQEGGTVIIPAVAKHVPTAPGMYSGAHHKEAVAHAVQTARQHLTPAAEFMTAIRHRINNAVFMISSVCYSLRCGL